MSIRSTHVHAAAAESGVGHATAVALAASGMDTGSTWHDLETGPGTEPVRGADRSAWRRLRELFRF
ncbi:MAG TPA: hypothetical protein VNT50_02930 [Microbacterium sp.]|uniref:hypothetical protein n=1 Tax=Microbacterium sp. TaxID=51671 RepID=UPI002C6A39F1|nr:hypothetical protein [Microbacterium sp.]HWI30416.1 hypothetical protein [Microbacterium sp.]